jgi:hypothetical protein
MNVMAKRRKFETILTDNKLVSVEQLKQIVAYAHAVGIDLYEAVLQKKIAPPDAVMMAYAESIGLPFIHLSGVSIDEEVAARIDPMTARQHSFVPISIDQGHVLLATTKPIIPDVADKLRMIFNLPVRCVICAPAELNVTITTHYPRGTAQIANTERSNILAPQKTPPAKPLKPAEPMSEAESKDRFLKTFVAFNFTFAFVYFSLHYLPLLKGMGFSTFVLIGIVTSGIAAGITWKTLSR